jgi:hypothetical protein
LEVIASLTKGKIRPLNASNYDFLVSKLDSTTIPRVYTDFAPKHPLQLKPETYEAILNASEGVEGFDKILRRIETDLSVKERDERDEQILSTVLNKLANLSVATPEGEQTEGEQQQQA